MRLNIPSKLILFTVLPVLGVYSVLFWLGVSHVKIHLSNDAQRMLLEQARHQASRLALAMSQVPALAESLGDVVLAEPSQPQALLYAHLIDGLRRTPIARTAAVLIFEPAPRGALMQRGAASGEKLVDAKVADRPPGWQLIGQTLRLNRPIRRRGVPVGVTSVELSIDDVYREIERPHNAATMLFVGDDGHGLFVPTGIVPEMASLADSIPASLAEDIVHTISDAGDDGAYWVVSARLPGFPWHITAVSAAETALGPARHQARLFATALLISLLAIVLIIGVATRRITRPLARLDSSVRRITRGDFSVAPELDSNDELGELARAIRRMTLHIRDREQQLRRSHQVLEQRVAERTSALQQSNARLMRQIDETRRTQEALRLANEQAQQASRAKSEFLSNMSHELRTPLHGVLGYAQILRRDDGCTPAQLESLEAIERCGQHLLTLINDILDLAKIEAGQMQVNIQPTDLLELVGDVHTIVAQRAANKGLDLQVEITDVLPAVVLTDPVRLRQILLNLLGNAIKFTGHGAITLSVQYSAQMQLCFAVSDTGVGIPSDRVEAIFDAFHQAREGQAVDGTGLGLAINQRLIALLGGEPLRVESTPGTGSRFSFSIPCDAEPATLASAADTLTRSDADAICRVLIVGGQEEDREPISDLLRKAGCTVESLARLDGVTRYLQERAVDLVVFYIRGPDQDRNAALEGLRCDGPAQSPKLVAVSDPAFHGAADTARDNGFDAFLIRPLDNEQLIDSIERLLGVRLNHLTPGLTQADPFGRPHWPTELADSTAQRIRAAIDVGDVGSLFQLAEELADNPLAPAADVDDMASMARLFDFDGLRQLSERLQGDPLVATDESPVA